jgi:branched-chain amino acid transport system permease protein
MNNLLQLLVSGLLAGGIYALIALGVVIIYKSSQVFNFAQGDFVMMGAFAVWGLLVWSGLPFWISLITGVGIIVVVGLLVERLLLRPLIGQPLIAAMMMTIGLSYILKGIVALVWGNVVVAFPQILPSGVLHLGNVALSYQALTGFILGLITIGIFVIIFQYTRVGLRMRATAEDSQLAQSTGVRVRSIFGISWAATAVVGLIGGVLLGNIVGISPSLGDMGLAAAFPAVLLGGLDSIPGVVIGALLIGVLQSLTAGYIDPLVGGGMKEVAPYFVLVIILIIRPYGIFGLKRIERI